MAANEEKVRQTVVVIEECRELPIDRLWQSTARYSPSCGAP